MEYLRVVIAETRSVGTVGVIELELGIMLPRRTRAQGRAQRAPHTATSVAERTRSTGAGTTSAATTSTDARDAASCRGVSTSTRGRTRVGTRMVGQRPQLVGVALVAALQ